MTDLPTPHPAPFVAIEGIIAAGKTTTATILADRLGLQLVVEDWSDHPFLERFKADWATFSSEVAYALLHAAAGRTIPDGGAVADYAPLKSIVFADATLGRDDQRLMEALVRRVTSDIQLPDIVVLLDVPPSVCLERARRRGRAAEADLSTPFLDRLRSAYLTQSHQLAQTTRRLELSGAEPPTDVADRVAAIIAAFTGGSRERAP